MKKGDIHILVIDDDPGIRESLSELIVRLGYKVTAVGTPAEAESVIKIKTVHLAIIDCMLPIINGIDLAKKFLQTNLKSVPVILISGVFRDKQFANDAIRKSGAAAFFTKPLDIKEFSSKINEYVSPLIDAKTGSLASLLSKLEISKREARKLLDYLDDIAGYDLMLVLGVLMKARSFGYVNVTDQSGELTGFTVVDGEIVDVDTLKTPQKIKSLLVDKGLILESDFESAVSQAASKDVLTHLVKENLISPHMMKIVKLDKIIDELKKLFVQSSVSVNFAENKNLDPSGVSLKLSALEPIFYDIIVHKVSINWIKSFFGDWEDKVIATTGDFKNSTSMSCFSSLEMGKPLCEKIHSGDVTINELLEEFPSEAVYPTLYVLTASRQICFNDITKLRSKDDYYHRLEKIMLEIEGKNPFEVLRFFGAKENPLPAEVDRIYKEFAKNNHPDKLPKDASKELLDLNNRVFSVVSEAHQTLFNPQERKKYMDKQREGEAKRQIRSEQLMEQAMPLLDRGMVKEAYKLISEAYELYNENYKIKLLYWWSKAKVEPNSLKEEIVEIHEQLRSFDYGVKETALYQFVLGLIHLLESDFEKSDRAFNRALDYEKNFLPARRELLALKAISKKSKGKSKTADFLTGDITTLVSGLFKNKKSG